MSELDRDQIGKIADAVLDQIQNLIPGGKAKDFLLDRLRRRIDDEIDKILNRSLGGCRPLDLINMVQCLVERDEKVPAPRAGGVSTGVSEVSAPTSLEGGGKPRSPKKGTRTPF